MEVPDISGNSEVFEDFDDIEFMCPFCNTVVEIFNYDLRLSVDLHSELKAHQIAFKLYEENNNSQEDKLRQSCDSVNIVAPIDSGASSLHKNENDSTSDSTIESYRDMLCSSSKRNVVRDGSILSREALVKSQTTIKNTQVDEHLNRIFDSNIPEIIVKNQNYLNIKNEKFFMCTLCNAHLEIKSNPQNTKVSFIQHLNCNHHKTRVRIYVRSDEHKQQLRALLISQLKPPSIKSKYLTTVFGSDLPAIININKKFLSQYQNGCACTLCGVYMEVPNVAKNAIYNFSQHLNSYVHKENFKKAKTIPPRAIKSPGRVYFVDNKSVSNSFSKSTPLGIDKNKEVALPVKCKSLTSSTKKQNSSNPSNISVKYLTDVFGPVLPEIINKNMNFLSRYKNGCSCTLCGICMEVPTISKNAIYNFSQHLQGQKHNENLKNIMSKEMTSPYKTLYNCESDLLTENEKYDSPLYARSEKNTSNVASESYSYVLSTDKKNSTSASSTENESRGSPLSADHEKYASYLSSKNCSSGLSTDIYSSALSTDRNNYTFAVPTEIYSTPLSSDSCSSALSTDRNNYTFAVPTEIYSTALSSDSCSSALSTDRNNYTFAVPTETCSTALSSDSCSSAVSADRNNYIFAVPNETYSTALSSDSCSSALSTDRNNYTFAVPTKTYSTALSSDSCSSALSADRNNFTFSIPNEIYSSALSTEREYYSSTLQTDSGSKSDSSTESEYHEFSLPSESEIPIIALNRESYPYPLTSDGRFSPFEIGSSITGLQNHLELNVDHNTDVLYHQIGFNLYEGNNSSHGEEIYSSWETTNCVASTDFSILGVPNDNYLSSDSSKVSYRDILCNNSFKENVRDSDNKTRVQITTLPKSQTTTKITEVDIAYEFLKKIFNPNIPKIIVKNLNYLTMKNEKFFSCKLCNAQLAITSNVKTTKQSFTQHLESNNHKTKVGVTNRRNDECKEQLRAVLISQLKQATIENKYLSTVFGPDLPDIIKKNKKFLTQYQNGYACILCGVYMTVTNPIHNFSQHLRSYRHKEKVKEAIYIPPRAVKPSGRVDCPGNKSASVSFPKTTPLVTDNNRVTLPLTSKPLTFSTVKENPSKSSNVITKYLTNIFGPILPEIVNKNINFLSHYGNGCVCTLCNVYMEVPLNSKNAIYNFSQHLQSQKHNGNLKSSCQVK